MTQSALITNHQTYYYLKDRLGLINNNQQLVESYHNAFGKLSIKDTDSIIINNSNYNNPYAYTGRRFDNESGLYYYRNCYYQPSLARFISNDPQGFVDGYNMYAYVKSNSLKYTDPFGLRARSSCYNLCGSNIYFYNPYKSKEEPSLSNHVVGSNPVNSLLENTHTALDVAGLSPSVSIIPDVINAVIHTIEGDFTNAGISGVVAIPFFGQG